MKGKDLIKDMVRGEVPEKEELKSNVLKAVEDKSLRRRSTWKLASALASILVLAIAAVWLFNSGLFNIRPDENGPGLVSGSSEPSSSNDQNLDVDPSGVFIPQIEVGIPNEHEEADMIGFFIYEGEVYMQADWHYGEDAVNIRKLLGEKIAVAKGGIDEWSKEDDYVELAGSVHGDVYEVHGYDRSFRLAMTGSYEDDDGHIEEWLNFYECLNNITLKTGKDLFQDRLKLSHNWVDLKAQKHEDWDYSIQKYNVLEGVSNDDINRFIDVLFSSPFVDLGQSTDLGLYNEPLQQTHLRFIMPDGMHIRLRLFEGGYVGYENLSWIFVKMPGEIFDLIFNASK